MFGLMRRVAGWIEHRFSVRRLPALCAAVVPAAGERVQILESSKRANAVALFVSLLDSHQKWFEAGGVVIEDPDNHCCHYINPDGSKQTVHYLIY